MGKTITLADLFCGAGGTSTGAVEAIESLGHRAALTAVNHWPVAVETHKVNHPDARHFCASLDSINPRHLFDDGQLDLLWASPECTHHSIARGGKPVSDQSRATAWCVARWAEALRPNYILIENVKEFQTWGPIGVDGRPLKSRAGETFQAWIAVLRSLGYTVDWRVLCAANYGDPTTRERLFVQAVRGRRKIFWPDATHSRGGQPDLFGARKPWVAAREVIDWDIPSGSIYERKRPLADKTLRRIFDGLHKFGIQPFVASWDHQSGNGVWGQDAPLSTVTTKARHGVVEPFLVELKGTTDGHIGRSSKPLSEPLSTVQANGTHHGLAEPYLVQVAHGDSGGTRTRPLTEPMSTICGTRGEWALCSPALLPQQSDGVLRPIDEPVPTVATAGAIALVEPFLVSYYGQGGPRRVAEPMDTITTKDRFALVRPEVVVRGKRYLLDIRFRMLQPKELAAAQGFRADYRFTGTKTEQVKQIGNAVPRRMARAIVYAALNQCSDVSALDHPNLLAA
jgi:DNA (cytosine-5)-methyltransferase 1